MNISISELEERTGISKRAAETGEQYLERLGAEAGVSAETVKTVCVVWERTTFSPEGELSKQESKLVEEYLTAIEDAEFESAATPSRHEPTRNESGREHVTEAFDKSDAARQRGQPRRDPFAQFRRLTTASLLEDTDGTGRMKYVRRRADAIFDTGFDYTLLLSQVTIGVLLYYRGLGGYSLKMWDESTYANAAKHMVTEGYWLIPHISGGLGGIGLHPFLEKPPFVMWLQAISMVTFGINEFAVRFQSATFTILTACLIYIIGRDMLDRASGVIAGVVFLTTPAVFGITNAGRLGGLDMALVFFGSLFVYLSWTIVDREDHQRQVLAGAVAGIAVLVKGVGAGIFVFILAPLMMYYYKLFLNKYTLYAITVVLLITLPWPIYVWTRHGNLFVSEIFVDQVLRRAAGETYVSPAGKVFEFMNYPYIQDFPLHFDPWVYLLIPATVYVLWTIGSRSDRRKQRDGLFLIWWGTIVIGFFTLTGNHSWYLLPMYVPCALLVGWLLSETVAGERGARIATVAGLFAVLVFSPRMSQTSPVTYVRPVAGGAIVPGSPTSGLPFLISVVLFAIVVFRYRELTGLFKSTLSDENYLFGKHVLVGTVAVLFALSVVGGPPIIGHGYWQQKQMAEAISQETQPDDVIYISEKAYGTRGPFVPLGFYTDREINHVRLSNKNADSANFVLVERSQLSALPRDHTVIANYTHEPHIFPEGNISFVHIDS